MPEIVTIQLRFNLNIKEDKQLYRIIQGLQEGTRGKILKKTLLICLKKDSTLNNNRKLKAEDEDLPNNELGESKQDGSVRAT